MISQPFVFEQSMQQRWYKDRDSGSLCCDDAAGGSWIEMVHQDRPSAGLRCRMVKQEITVAREYRGRSDDDVVRP